MRLATCNYAMSDTPRRRWGWRTPGAVAAVLLMVVAAPWITVRQVESRMDAVTGSVTWKTVWLFGISSGARVDVSPLEMRLRSSGISWTPSWRLLHNAHRNVFGGATLCECGSAPAIYQLHPVIKQFTDASTDAELREFVRIMQSGTDDQQKAAIDAAGEKGMAAGAAE